MDLSDLSIALAVFSISLVASFAMVWGLTLIRKTADTQPSKLHVASGSSSTFLLHGDQIADHDVIGMPGFLPDIDDLHDWTDLRNWLGLRFDDLPISLSGLPTQQQNFHDQLSENDGLTLSMTQHDDVTRITLRTEAPVSSAAWHAASHLSFAATQARSTLDHVSFPIWKTGAAGELTWRNTPMATIMKQSGQLPNMIPAAKGSTEHPRFSVVPPGNSKPTWYEVDSRKISPDETLHVATRIDQIVRAETAQRDFVQTLTKTFANLTTGLAVFDKNRQLALFNPALVDLTGISVSFLSARPDVIRFFDELRERQVLPEPKNYANLRTHIRDVIAKANEGNYLEIWNLPGGVTYRVTGRPHPDGAVAFLIEDISAEVLKTRLFRTQIDLGQSVIDGLDEAIVVIAPNDLLLLCNTACTDLLKIDPGNSFADMSVVDLLAACRDRFRDDALWSVFEAGVRNGSTLHECDDRYLNLLSGERLQYRLKILPGGARMVGFSRMSNPALTPTITAAE